MAVYKEGNSWFIYYYHNRKRYRESIGPGTKRDAIAALAKRKVQIKEGRFFDKKRVCDLTFNDAVREFLEFSKAHKKSFLSDQDVCRRLSRFFEDRKVCEILPSDIERYKEHRRGKLTRKGTPVAVSTINRELAALKTILARLVRDRKLEFNPVSSVKFFNESNLQRDRVLNDKEYESLLAASNSELRPIIEFGYHTGMRKSEILGLTWDKIDFNAGLIRLSHLDTKNAEKRIIPLNARLREILQGIVRKLHQPLIFHRNGRRILSIRESFKNACIKAGIEDFRFHDLRHTAVTRWVIQGIPEKAIMAVSGHKTRKVFDRYTNLTDANICDLMRTGLKQNEVVEKRESR